jgi:putative endonuclease
MFDLLLSLFEKLFAEKRDEGDIAPHLETGLRGEEAAEKALVKDGYMILARRWGTKQQRGDIDLVAWKDEALVFVEVKARSAHDRAAAEIAVDRSKRKTLRKLARLYLNHFKQRPQSVRFDVMAVYLLPGKPAEVQQIQSAFGWKERRRYF